MNRDIRVRATYHSQWPTPLRVDLSSPLGKEYFLSTFDLAQRVHYVWQSNDEIYFDHGSWRDNSATNAVKQWFVTTGMQDEIVAVYRKTYGEMRSDYVEQLRRFAISVESKAVRVSTLGITQILREMYGSPEHLAFKPSTKYDNAIIFDRTLPYGD